MGGLFLEPVFGAEVGHPYRWALLDVFSGFKIFRPRYWDDRYIHYTKKEFPAVRDVYAVQTDNNTHLRTVRRTHIMFLTAFHREFYEDGKYVEVWNDPLNYILENPADYTAAFDHAEKRIGNYRMGVRRHVTHLGGTISDDELNYLADDIDVPLTVFPLVPPKPATAFLKPFRANLLTSDVGYIDYVKAAHPDETTTARYAYQAKQSTGFTHFIFQAGHSNMMYESSDDSLVSQDTIEVKDIETVVDPAIDIATDSVTGTLLPADGEYTIYNIKNKVVLRLDGTGISLEQYNKAIAPNSTLGTLQSYINIGTDGDIIIESGTTTVAMGLSGNIVLTDSVNTVTMDKENSTITLAVASGRTITMGTSVVNVT